MIQFNELRITPDNKCLIIDASIEDLAPFKKVTIDSILIYTQDTFLTTGQSTKARIAYSPDNKVSDVIQSKNGRHVRLELQSPLVSLNENNMYFVYVVADVSNAPESMQAPCSCNKEIILGTVVNLYPVYTSLIGSVRELEQDCASPKTLINQFLRFQSVEAAIRSGNYPLAIKYWNKFFLREKVQVNYKPCGCHGGN